MEKKILKSIIVRQQELVCNVDFIERPLTIEANINYVLVGLRRAGKTYMLYQTIRHLLNEGHKKEEILFVNFEDERINGICKEELHEILEAYGELYDTKPIVFLDEVQNIDGWEHFARRLADEKYKVFVTGSNAYMLSREIASTLGGRYQIREIYPFSFMEYLKWHGVVIDKTWEYGSARQTVRRMFDDYICYGGISEVFPLKDKRGWLTTLYQKVLYSDVVMRNRIRNDKALSLLVKKLADSVLQPTSVKRLQDMLTGIGEKVTRETVTAFLKYLHDAYLTFSLANYSDGIKEREGTRKHYFYDNGILNLFLFQPEAKLLENIVALSLVRKYGEDEVFYYRRNVEVDFVVPRQSLAIQVAYDLELSSTKSRETASLASLCKYMDNISNPLIITMETEDTIYADDVKIEVIPVWKWLIEISNVS